MELSKIIDSRVIVTDLSWERIFLNVKVCSEIKEDIRFCLIKTIKTGETKTLSDIEIIGAVPLEGERVGTDYNFHVNMSIADGRGFLDNNRYFWAYYYENNPDVVTLCSLSTELAYRLIDMDKIFRYGKGKYSYNVFFTTNTYDDEHLIFILNSKFMIENLDWKKPYKLGDRTTALGKWKCLLKKLKLGILNGCYHLFCVGTRRNGKNILFMSETKPYLWGNLKYIDSRIKERGLDEQFNLTYSLRLAVGENKSFLNWLSTLYKVAKQDIVFVDDYAPIFSWLNLDPRTKLIQVWHAGEGFKSVGYGRFGVSGSPRPKRHAHRAYTYAITGSERLVHVYSEVFGIPEKNILPLGMARLDGFLDENIIKEKREEFYSRYPNLKNKKIILFAPTFRGLNQSLAYYDYNRIDLKKIYDVCGDKYVWAFKMHPFIKEKPQIPKEYRDRIIDLGECQNINDLYYITEIMVTDYSSAYYEFALMSKPILFYTYDREYYELLRGVHKPVKETAPGKVCDTFDELINSIKSEDFEIKKTLKFREENFKNYDGKAADKIIDNILLK